MIVAGSQRDAGTPALATFAVRRDRLLSLPKSDMAGGTEAILRAADLDRRVSWLGFGSTVWALTLFPRVALT
jgi:hypothetical protein